MKKTYEAPATTLCGDVVRETKNTVGGSETPIGAPASAGSVGFNL
jgi:hypothetical protein